MGHGAWAHVMEGNEKNQKMCLTDRPPTPFSKPQPPPPPTTCPRNPLLHLLKLYRMLWDLGFVLGVETGGGGGFLPDDLGRGRGMIRWRERVEKREGRIKSSNNKYSDTIFLTT